MRGLNWPRILILITWQKIAPILILSYIVKEHILFFSIIIIVSSVIRGLQGLNQICIRKIIAYSSINHVSWIIATLISSIDIWLYYFIVYCFININIYFIFKKYRIFYINQLANILTLKKKTKFIFILNFLSLGGLPPFLGFLPKWIAINRIINNEHYFIATILIIFTLISLYFYLRITFSSLTVYSKETLIIIFNKINYFHFITNLFSLIGLIICRFIDTQY